MSAVKNEDGDEVGLQADIYPYQEKTANLSEDEVKKLIRKVVDDYNATMPAHKRITKLVIRKEPFEKTTSGKIKRKYN